MKIIDCHCHIYPQKIAEKAVKAVGDFYDIPMDCQGGTANDLLTEWKPYGVEKMLVHSTATRPDQVAHINDFLLGVLQNHSEFIGFGTLHPDYDDNEGQIEKLLANGIKGIKFHPDFGRLDILSPEMYHIYEMLTDKLTVMFHVGDPRYDYSHPTKIKKILEDFPNLTVIGAHMGGYTVWEESLDILCGKNIYFDTSSTLSFISPELAVKIIKKHGIEKILFGTDYPMWHIKQEIENMEKLPLSDDEKEIIFHENAERLLQIK
ncbi:MAG: amidohydrolase family protein [Clostridia bacterium]|nr:amidohydrolase family protein [Clostridia bacterium]